MKPNDTESRLLTGLLSRWTLALVILFAAMAVFLELAEDVWLKEGFSWDVPLMQDIHRLSSSWLNVMMKAVTFTSAGVAVVLTILIAAWLWFRQHQKPQALLLSITVFGAVITNAALKFLFARPRPEVFPPLVVETSYSFPSGHTTTAAAFYGMLAILLWQAHHRRWALLSGVWVFAVAFSRIYLGAHYPSDVLGSLALGTLWLVIASAVYWSYCRRLAANPTDLNRQSP